MDDGAHTADLGRLDKIRAPAHRVPQECKRRIERYLAVRSNGHIGIANGIVLIRTVNDATQAHVFYSVSASIHKPPTAKCSSKWASTTTESVASP